MPAYLVRSESVCGRHPIVHAEQRTEEILIVPTPIQTTVGVTVIVQCGTNRERDMFRAGIARTLRGASSGQFVNVAPQL
jgi:hypothetical protein